VTGQIEFKNIRFRYPTREDLEVLKGVDITFDAGETTAIVGPSGSGKSTIIQLLERFYNPTSGEILFDGQNVKNIDLRSMRSFMGYVGQEPILFNTTIKENMLFAKRDASEAEIVQALKDANAWSFIQNKMKNGIHTFVGGAGGSLSGG
jgi:ATP-binding cassette subfamily B (MDR/TAP) protein 1